MNSVKLASGECQSSLESGRVKTLAGREWRLQAKYNGKLTKMGRASIELREIY